MLLRQGQMTHTKQENLVSALKRELQTLTVEEYMQTVKDLRFPQKAKCVSSEKNREGNREG